MSADLDPTRRFSNRVSDYVKYRPSYPPALLDMLSRTCGLTRAAVAADVGSGTGKLTEALLSRCARVFAVEPNLEMRLAAEELLGGAPGFTSVPGTAEATTLEDSSVDLVTAGQAFHWFKPAEAAVELRRILRPGGFTVLVWNDRDPSRSPFLTAYDGFLQKYSVDYGRVNHHTAVNEEVLGDFFSRPFVQETFPNPMTLDFPSLLGGYLSASYALTRDHPRFVEAESALRELFSRHARGGRVEYPLITRAYYAVMKDAR